MRDVFHVFPNITAGAVSTVYPAADFADFGAIDRNTDRFVGHHTGQASHELRACFKPTTDVAASQICTLQIQDSVDGISGATALAGATMTLPVGGWTTNEIKCLPLPLTHRRYLRTAVSTGGTWAASKIFESWFEFGQNVK